MRHVSLLLVVTAAMTACAPNSNGNGGDDDDDTGFVDGGGVAADGGPGFVDAGGFNEGPDAGSSSGACDKMDILFVVDNSGSMEEEQASLREAFPQFLQVIETYHTSSGAMLDYHIGITTTDHGPGSIFSVPDDGAFVTEDRTGFFGPVSCNFPSGRTFLQRGDTDVATRFTCAAKVGTSGSGFEMPLQEARLALTDRISGSNPTNAGFLREEALLAVVFLTDENDCSTTAAPTSGTPASYCTNNNLEPVGSYITAFDNVKGGERGRWATSIIAIPPGAGLCGGSESSENVRLKAFADATGTNAVFSNICAGNMAQSLMDAFETFSVACENIPPVD